MNAPLQPASAGVSRRKFLVSSAAGAFVLFFRVDGSTRATEAAELAAAATQVGTWIRIAPSGIVTILVGSAEMGQGAMSGLAQILAEDLMVDWKKVRAEHAPADPAFANPLFHFQLTGGSSSIRGYYATLRKAGATAREMMIAAAAQTWGVPASECHATKGTVVHAGDGRTLDYGALAALAATMPVPSEPPLASDATLRLIGRPVKRLDIPAKVDGSAVYGIDVRIPDMAYAVVKHCPTLGGTLAATPPVPKGALAVVPLKVLAGTGRGTEVAGMVNAVAVVAENTWYAIRAANQLQVRWNVPASSAAIDSAALLQQARDLLDTGPAAVAESVGDARATLDDPDVPVIERTYTLPYLAHAMMEVPNCTVRLTADRCEIWAPTQGQAIAVGTATALTGLTPQQVTIHTTFLGGGLGRKIEQDYISQAIQTAQAIGRPVKLMWTREEDFARDQYRPLAAVRVRAALGTAGNVAAWQYRNCSPSITVQRRPTFTGIDSQAIDGSTTATGCSYAFDSRLVEHVLHPAPVPLGYWRSVGHSINSFAIESMIDELADAAGIDAYEYRRRLLASDARGLAVLDRVAAMAKWGGAVPSGRARGLAFSWSFGSAVAQVVEISAPAAGRMTVHNVWCAIDCGRAVNPDSVAAQMEGGIVHGISAALWGQVTFTAGRAGVRNFDGYPMVRMSQMPSIAVTVMPPDPTVPIGGAGEPGVPPVAPALAGAYARLTGVRI
ncbi:molybdopterin-dependent oxidoreductase, partial [Candidatus Binatia bacterium]|nr:molybdopterin-dependent oxidoreductase [Candidatus Binatia bacterium]